MGRARLEQHVVLQSQPVVDPDLPEDAFVVAEDDERVLAGVERVLQLDGAGPVWLEDVTDEDCVNARSSRSIAAAMTGRRSARPQDEP
jgi:hypothetical protein